ETLACSVSVASAARMVYSGKAHSFFFGRDQVGNKDAMKVSLGSWAFSFGPFADNPIPFEKTVKRLSDAGYDGIEICGFPPHVTLDKYPDAASRQELVQFLKDHRLGVSGYAADFTSANPVAVGNKQKYLDL